MASCSVLVFCVAILIHLLGPAITPSWDRRVQEGPSMASFPGKVSHGLLECSGGIVVPGVSESPFGKASEIRLAAPPLLGSWGTSHRW